MTALVPHYFSPAITPVSQETGLRKLLKPMVDPATFDFWAGKLNPLWSWDRPLARVLSRHQEALNTISLELQANSHFRGFTPGQHIHVSTEVNGRRTARSYSLTNTPNKSGRLSITIKQVDDGKMSTHLCRHVQVGDVLEISQAFGSMAPPQTSGPWLFLAAGSGITPLMGLTRWLAEGRMPEDLTLIYWVKTRAELCFAQELQSLSKQFSNFKLHIVLTHETDHLPGETQGMLSASQLVELVGDLSAQHVLACGPHGFVETARSLAQGTARSFFAEGFTPASTVAADAQAPATVRVELTRSNKTVEISTGLSILEALEAQGLSPQSGCRMGVCHTCVCTRNKGTVQNMHTGQLHAEEGFDVRLCVSRARTDLTLDL